MRYRKLGRTGLEVSEIGFGGEWLERHTGEEGVRMLQHAHDRGINIVDCWMADPKSRDIIGEGIEDCRESWYVQGHIGSTWQGGQYVRTRDLDYVKPAFEDLLQRTGHGYVDLGMIHYVDAMEDWTNIQRSGYLDYVFDLHEKGTIRHIGLSTHNPRIAKLAAQTGFIEMLLFSINPAFDMKPASENLETMFADYNGNYAGIDHERAELYQLCETENVGITVMKGFFGGRLLQESTSPFGAAFTPVQLLHYALTRPAVASVMCGFDTVEQIDAALAYETADENAKDYASVIASAPLHAYSGQCVYCGHCKPCPEGLDIAMINKFYDLACAQNEIPSSVRAHYLALGTHASSCVACHGCESRCPFHVKVAERMKKAAECFGV